MARQAVKAGSTSVAHACASFGVIQTCYRYQAKASEENSVIADWLIRLASAYRDLGLRIVLSAPSEREGLWLEPPAGLPHLSRTGAQPANQASEALGTRAARATGRAGKAKSDLVNGLHA